MLHFFDILVYIYIYRIFFNLMCNGKKIYFKKNNLIIYIKEIE